MIKWFMLALFAANLTCVISYQYGGDSVGALQMVAAIVCWDVFRECAKAERGT